MRILSLVLVLALSLYTAHASQEDVQMGEKEALIKFIQTVYEKSSDLNKKHHFTIMPLFDFTYGLGKGFLHGTGAMALQECIVDSTGVIKAFNKLVMHLGKKRFSLIEVLEALSGLFGNTAQALQDCPTVHNEIQEFETYTQLFKIPGALALRTVAKFLLVREQLHQNLVDAKVCWKSHDFKCVGENYGEYVAELLF